MEIIIIIGLISLCISCYAIHKHLMYKSWIKSLTEKDPKYTISMGRLRQCNYANKDNSTK